MENEEQVKRQYDAMIAELIAEYAAEGYNMKSFAAKLGIDYHTFRLYIKKERQIPAMVLLAAVNALSVSNDEFFKHARERAERS